LFAIVRGEKPKFSLRRRTLEKDASAFFSIGKVSYNEKAFGSPLQLKLHKLRLARNHLKNCAIFFRHAFFLAQLSRVLAWKNDIKRQFKFDPRTVKRGAIINEFTIRR
jgi:hypothetical protein